MQIYLVGGAVRDKLLCLAQKDRDWLVVGATPEQLIKLGFQQVGKDFPVFLHPQTKEEYALARTEKKQGQGYTGFICDFSPEITLEEDLKRRDLTINAMAENAQGELFDPYGGKKDLTQKILRHVSDAFSEDPLRVLRVARFYARLAHLGFAVAPETKQLMREMTKQGELQHLTPERVWQETEKALQSESPQKFFQLLNEVDALAEWFPELKISAPLIGKIFLFSIENLPEGLAAFIQLCSPLTAENIKVLCQRLKVPVLWKDMVLNYQQLTVILSQTPTAEGFLTALNQLDPWRKQERFHQLLEIYAQLEGKTRELKAFENSFQRAQQINIQAIIQAGFQKAAIKNELNRQRLEVIENYLHS